MLVSYSLVMVGWSAAEWMMILNSIICVQLWSVLVKKELRQNFKFIAESMVWLSALAIRYKSSLKEQIAKWGWRTQPFGENFKYSLFSPSSEGTGLSSSGIWCPLGTFTEQKPWGRPSTSWRHFEFCCSRNTVAFPRRSWRVLLGWNTWIF